MGTEALIGCFVQHHAIIGMGDGGEELGSLLERTAGEVDGPVFGHDPMGIGSRRDHACALVEHRYDLGDTFLGT